MLVVRRAAGFYFFDFRVVTPEGTLQRDQNQCAPLLGKRLHRDFVLPQSELEFSFAGR